MSARPPWEGPEGEVSRLVTEHSQQSLDVYRADARRVDEDAGQEEDLATGGYGRRQLFELVQNGADALIEEPGGRIEVLLTSDALYCANEGEPLRPNGVSALMHAHISPKRGSEIGRFGLGFKSVLGATRKPRFYSRTASFAFDADAAERQIREVVGNRQQYPVLRLATPLVPEADGTDDPALAAMMEWATTIVKLPLEGDTAWLQEDLDSFPAEFLLFSPHVGTLTLDNRVTGVRRTITLEADEADLKLSDGVDESLWKVLSATLRPSDTAKADAGKLAARDELPLQWAVPVDGRMRTGRFWAFFPLRDETTLSGIANAPWQVNDDRTGLLETSRLNRELLDRLADLVVDSVEPLFKPSDPGWVLDVLPARGRERRSWGDEFLSREVFERLRGVPCIADMTGRLRTISEVHIPPQPSRDPDRDSLEFWAEAPSLPVDWCHPSTIWTTTRRSRIDRLLEAESLKERPLSEWLESVISDPPTVADSRHAIQLAGRLISSDEELGRNLSAVRRSSILLVANDGLSMIDPSSVFLPSEAATPGSGLQTVHPELGGDDAVRPILERMGLQQVSAELQLELSLRRARQGWQADWHEVWSIARTVGDPMTAARILRDMLPATRPVKVRVTSGAWSHSNEVLLEGTVAKATRDPRVVVDATYHASDLEILRAIGVGSAPEVGYPAEREPYVRDYLQECYRTYTNTDLGTRSTPAESHMEFVESELCGPLTPIKALTDEGRAEFTVALLESSPHLHPWTLRHSTQPKYPARQFENPALKIILEEGRLRTAIGIRSPRDCVGSGFKQWGELLPVAAVGADHEQELGIPADLPDLASRGDDALSLWADLCANLNGSPDDKAVGAFLAAASEAGLPPPPSGIWCRVGDSHELLPAVDVAACDSQRTFKALRDLAKPALCVPDRSGVDTLVRRWGLRTTEEDVRTTPVWAASGAGIAIADYFPVLRDDLRELGLLEYEVVPCSELAFEVSTAEGTMTEDVPFVVLDDDRKLLWVTETGPEQLLRELDTRYSLDLSADEFDGVIAQRVNQETQERLTGLRSVSDKRDRLVKALGPAVLRSHLPIGLLEAVEAIHGPADDRRLAELLLAVHGYDALRSVREDLDTAGFSPPTRWAGSWEARQFVRRLGFEDEYAGFRGTSRDRQLFVPGPSGLPEEHPYQREIISRIHELLTGGEEHRRALLSLPTGAGKTRVAVQGLVEAIVNKWLDSPILWVAQSDELCEQAVQSWSEVWRRYGTDDELTVSRLWAANEVEEAISGPQAVVATVDKLRNKVDDDGYDWLKHASCVVVDEAHTATTPEYTRVLEWLGIQKRGATTKTRCPLIGLTATPFRGRSEDQTRRLADRFGRRRLDSEAEDPYGELQSLQVLATIDGEVLEGTSVELSPDEVTRFEQLRDVPKDVYRRIASDVDRNRRLLSSITGKPSDWPILLFAISTEHAHTLAALLRLEGIPAVSIDHETDSDLRRRYVEEFRRGDLRVLCNYSVLTQGFDAPAVRAIYVTRPTFSPNVYQQMIGRGLRGPLNGGKERCLIVNVADNWQRFGDQLAFRDFEYLWDRA